MHDEHATTGEGTMKKSKKTKIVATIGPASSSRAVLEKLIREGADTFRLNFSHGTHDQHLKSIKAIRAVSKKLDRPVAILGDLQGPKIRTGKTEGDAYVTLKKGRTVTITTKSIVCTETELCIDYKRLPKEVEVGQKILLNDGAIHLKVTAVDPKKGLITCKVLQTGEYSSRKGVNLPNVKLSTPALTPKDKKDLAFILDQDINYVALSFVRHPQDLKPLNAMIKKSGKAVRVIAKIEKPEALDCLEEILENCEGIMVARGDLGVETSLYKVPVIQKKIIKIANDKGKQVIVATQMLESMIHNASPTRAETSDVANAIFDDTDAIMMSGETAVGAYPAIAVRTMTLIAQESEKSHYLQKDFVDLQLKERHPPHAICEAAEWASRDLGGVPVIAFSYSGATGFYLSKIRNQSPIYMFTPFTDVANMLALAWNVTPFLLDERKTFHDFISAAESILTKRRLVKKGDLVVVVSGTVPFKGATNNLIVKNVGQQ
jgi:pyruvate kinase